MRTVLIFAHECAPYHRSRSTIGAQRPAQFARHLPMHGWRTIVICRDAERAESIPVAQSQAARREVQQAAAEALDATPADQSVILPTPSLAWDGWVDWCARRAERGPAVFRKATTLARLWAGDYSRCWQPCARWAARAVLERTRIDACMAEHSPDAGLFLADWLHRTAGTPWIADFRDPILRPLPPMAQRVYAPIVRHLLRSASGAVEVTPYWSELFSRRFARGRPVWTIPNGFDPREWPPTPPPVGPTLTIAYTGNINFNIQTIEPFLEGLARAKAQLGPSTWPSVRFVFRGRARAAVEALARRWEVAEALDTSDWVAHDEARAIARGADALLLLSIADVERRALYLCRGLFPGKVFDYFGARRPIWCVPGDRGQLDELLAQARAGVVLADAGAVAAAVVAALECKRSGRALTYAPDESVVGRYTRQHLAGCLAEALDALATRRGDHARDRDSVGR